MAGVRLGARPAASQMWVHSSRPVAVRGRMGAAEPGIVLHVMWCHGGEAGRHIRA